MEFNKLITTVDVHAAGEPLRIITGGVPPIRGKTMEEKKDYLANHYEIISHILMKEPRGHAGMKGCMITEPVHEDAHFGMIFFSNEGYSSMYGQGIIEVVTAAIETGLIDMNSISKDIIIDSVAGKVIAYAQWDRTTVESVNFQYSPSYFDMMNIQLNVPHRMLNVDIAYGGGYYAIVRVEDIGIELDVTNLVAFRKIVKEINNQIDIDLLSHSHGAVKEISGVILYDESQLYSSKVQLLVMNSTGHIDRSPSVSGISALMAALHHYGKIQYQDKIIFESIIGGQLVGEMSSITKYDGNDAITIQITGSAFITGLHQFLVDEDDPLKNGFLLK
ncbi:proline racemase family protein [Bacillus sp. SM2101]|uniref:proline racemase family protein n=1 Tax=Bacillus sp. SM2101 TaxID=2805366 RepID=UPI001BDEDBE8|nr:proline racemase family protein [Bacillus sp. SM2101]